MHSLYKIFFLLSFTIFYLPLIIAQNLVPNPSFEQYDSCPTFYGGNNLSSDWFPFTSSPDYFNSCSSSEWVGIPNNVFGSQLAATGNAYCGFMCYFQTNTNELLGIKLSDTLLPGIIYYVSIKVNLAGSSPCGIDKLGALFSTISHCDSLDSFNNCYSPPVPLTNYAHIYSSKIITDTTNWTTISGSFIADSAYQYIILGNLFDYANTNYTLLYGNTSCEGFWVYYYVDDVCVSTDSVFCAGFNSIYESIGKYNITLYPNPFNDKTTLHINANEKNVSAIIKINNVLGETVQISKKIFYNEGIEINRENLPAGIYLISVFVNNKIYNQKIIVTN